MSEPTKTLHLTQGEIDEALFLLEMADLENSNYTSLIQKLKTVRAQGGEVEAVAKVVEQDQFSEFSTAVVAELGDNVLLPGDKLYTHPPAPAQGVPVGEAIASANPEYTMAFFDAGKVPPRTDLFAGSLPITVPGSVPEGFALVPESMCLSYEDIEMIVTMTGWDQGRDDFGEGVLWVGTLKDDDGNETYGLHISCIEVMEEGALPVQEFKKPQLSTTPGNGWVKCSERFPALGQRVILKSNGVVQHYMPRLDQGDTDSFGGGGEWFWDFGDALGDEDYPLVDFEKDEWMELPQGDS